MEGEQTRSGQAARFKVRKTLNISAKHNQRFLADILDDYLLTECSISGINIYIMGRPYEFNREETLSKAMDVFWEKGYKATSIDDLVDRMGIQRGSIYNTFGDKHELFISAVEYYGEVITSRTLRVLEGEGSPIGNISKFFDVIVNTPPDRRSKGCLISNTVVELAPHDEEVAIVVRGIMSKIQSAFLECLERAVEAGELPRETNTQVLSNFLATSAHGLIVTGKSAIDREQLRNVVDVILSTLE